MSKPIPPILQRKFRLHSWEVDRKGIARPDILFSILLDSAWAHANHSKFSYDSLKEEGQLWVLSRFLADIHELPKWDEEINVETWSKGTDKLFGLRDFFVLSESGKKMVSATSAWLVIDRKTTRIQRINLEEGDFPVQLDRHAIETKLDKIERNKSDRTDFEHVVRHTDIDVNNHVNSSRYLAWILDSFPKSVVDERNLKSFEINFLAEAQSGDKVFVNSSDASDYRYCEVVREKDSAELCRARVVWE